MCNQPPRPEGAAARPKDPQAQGRATPSFYRRGWSRLVTFLAGR